MCHLVALEDVSTLRAPVWSLEVSKKSPKKLRVMEEIFERVGLVYPSKLDTVFIPKFAHPRWCSVFLMFPINAVEEKQKVCSLC